MTTLSRLEDLVDRAVSQTIADRFKQYMLDTQGEARLEDLSGEYVEMVYWWLKLRSQNARQFAITKRAYQTQE